jgi:hypothetical protein
MSVSVMMISWFIFRETASMFVKFNPTAAQYAYNSTARCSIFIQKKPKNLYIHQRELLCEELLLFQTSITSHVIRGTEIWRA